MAIVQKIDNKFVQLANNGGSGTDENAIHSSNSSVKDMISLTSSEFEQVKDTLPDDTIVCITDDTSTIDIKEIIKQAIIESDKEKPL